MPRYLSRETEPFGKWKGVPIYLTTILTAVMVLALIACAMFQAAGSRDHLLVGFFLPRNGWGNLLSLFTYPLVDGLNFFTLFGVFCFYTWCVGIESHLGRAVLTRLILLLLVAPASGAAVIAYGFGNGTLLIGNYYLSAGVIVAFATLYPNALVFGQIPFKFFAIACVFLGSVMAVAERSAFPLVALWSSCLVGFLYIRYALKQEYDDHVPLLARARQFFRRKPKFRVVPKNGSREMDRWEAPVEPEAAVSAEVDAILDKVARYGLQSLSPSEHATLQKAREELQRRDRR